MDSNKTFSEVVVGRRSIRVFKDTPVPRHALESALTYATFAPSAHNRQPWRFAVLTDTLIKTSLAEAMGEQLYQDRLDDGDPVADIERDVARSRARIGGAPVVIILFLSRSEIS